MASLQEITTRITSVKSTAKITKAMQMVSASKMLKAQGRSKAAQPYAEALAEMFKKIGNITEIENPFLNVREVKNVCFLIIGPSRGFVGGLISGLNSVLYVKQKELSKNYPGVKFSAITMHKVGMKVAENVGLESDFHIGNFIDNPTTTDLEALKRFLTDKFTNEEYDQVYIVYSKFISTSKQEPVVQKLLPVEIEINEEEVTAEEAKTEYIFEPDAKTVMNMLLPEYFENQIFAALLQSIASEHSARMLAMKNATDNANELKDNLTLLFNRSRQAAITQQIIEIVSGAQS